jgi:hypothetical protein
MLQTFVLRTHERALRKVLAGSDGARRVGIVGGGLFPRTALILRALLPESRLTVIDASGPNLDRARGILGASGIEFRHERYTGGPGRDHRRRRRRAGSGAVVCAKSPRLERGAAGVAPGGRRSEVILQGELNLA